VKNLERIKINHLLEISTKIYNITFWKPYPKRLKRGHTVFDWKLHQHQCEIMAND